METLKIDCKTHGKQPALSLLGGSIVCNKCYKAKELKEARAREKRIEQKEKKAKAQRQKDWKHFRKIFLYGLQTLVMAMCFVEYRNLAENWHLIPYCIGLFLFSVNAAKNLFC